MPVVLARVDNRLVHGQVLEAWVPRLGVERILVIDADLAADAFQRCVIEGLGLGGVGVRLCTPEEGAALLAGEMSPYRTLLLFAGVSQALGAMRRGVRFERLNLGNLHPRAGSTEVTMSVYLTAADLEGLAELVAAGIEVEAKAVPSDRSPDMAELLRKAGENGRMP